MIVPEGWVQLTCDWIGTSYSPGEVQFWLEQQAWQDLEVILLDQGQVPAGKHVVNARLIMADEGYTLWALFE